MINIDTYKILLERRKKELQLKLEEIEDLLDDPKDPSFSDGAIEREQDEVLQAQGNAGLVEIKAINAALTRIEGGTYGVCTSCEGEISEERLNLLPFTPVCRNCADR